MNFLKRIASFFIPVQLKKIDTAKSGAVEINLVNGRKVLDTANSNYSFGALQEVLRAGLVAANFNQEVENVLVLGMGAGSVVETIRFDFESEAFIELVDFDEEIIRIAEEDFGIDSFENINIICADALEYVRHNTQHFDFIIVDLFIGNAVPEQFCTDEFLHLLHKKMSENSVLIFNTIRKTFPEGWFKHMQNYFEMVGCVVEKLEEVEGNNDVLVIKKKS